MLNRMNNPGSWISTSQTGMLTYWVNKNANNIEAARILTRSVLGRWRDLVDFIAGLYTPGAKMPSGCHVKFS
jgi:hypothetical protein